MFWTPRELRPIEVGTKVTKQRNHKKFREVIYKTHQIPAPYDRIVAQLITEDEHAKIDASHEALRRQTYAQRVLDEFWKEIRKYNGPAIAFCSKVLTPILMRQLFAVDENYTPSVRESINGGPGNPTIEQVTSFYLSEDPTDPDWIPSYRRNLVYLAEPRWHLGIVMGKYVCGDAKIYATLRAHQDVLDAHIREAAETKEEMSEDVDSTEGEEPVPVPPLNITEVQMIFHERLNEFFAPELMLVVSLL